MRQIVSHSTKYDGSLHYRFLSYLVYEEPGLRVLYCPVNTPTESYRGQLLATRHSIGMFWTERYYNLHVSWHADWRPHNHYVNIATPATWDDQTLRFIDLDLDVIWRSATDEVVLDDEDEFILHQERFGYPPELIARAWQASEEVRDLIARRIAPFDGAQYLWRPPHGFA